MAANSRVKLSRSLAVRLRTEKELDVIYEPLLTSNFGLFSVSANEQLLYNQARRSLEFPGIIPASRLLEIIEPSSK